MHNEIIYPDASKPFCLCVDNHTCVVFCVNGVYCVSTPCGSGSVLIASSEPRGCRSRCCRRSLSLSFAVQMPLSWRPSGASWPPAAVSLSFPVSGLWPEGGDGGGPWVAFLALEVGAASPGRGVVGGKGRTFQEKDILIGVCVLMYA